MGCVATMCDVTTSMWAIVASMRDVKASMWAVTACMWTVTGPVSAAAKLTKNEKNEKCTDESGKSLPRPNYPG